MAREEKVEGAVEASVLESVRRILMTVVAMAKKTSMVMTQWGTAFTWASSRLPPWYGADDGQTGLRERGARDLKFNKLAIAHGVIRDVNHSFTHRWIVLIVSYLLSECKLLFKLLEACLAAFAQRPPAMVCGKHGHDGTHRRPDSSASRQNKAHIMGTFPRERML